MRNWIDTPISGMLFKEWITEGNIVLERCIKGLPTGAVFIRSWFDEYTDEAHIIWGHPSFDVVNLGDRVPIFLPVFESIAGQTLAEFVQLISQEEQCR